MIGSPTGGVNRIILNGFYLPELSESSGNAGLSESK